MQLRTACRVSHLVMLKAGYDGVSAIGHTGAGRSMLSATVERVGFEIGVRARQDRVRILHQFREIRFVERLDPRGERRVAEDDDRSAVLTGDARRLDRNVEAILDGRGRKHGARTIAVAAEDRLIEIALLDIGGQARAGPAPLDVDHDERDFGHRAPNRSPPF